MLHVPVERGGHADEAEALGGGRAVEHDDVVAALAPVLVDVHHGAQLFHAGQDGEFVRLDTAEPGGAQDAGDVGGDLLPVAVDLHLDVHFLDVEVIGDAIGVAGAAVEEVAPEVEGVGERMRRVDTHHQCPAPEHRELETGGGGEARLAHSAFAAEQENSHDWATSLDG